MKNQYFGDVNDYKKYGILRGLADPDTKVLVAWMLTPDDERSDGKFLGYLRDPKKWRSCDPVLFDFLCACRPDIHPRQVERIERWEGLRASYHSTIVPDDGPGRDQWTRSVIEAAVEHDLVFFDPDNGIEVKSSPKGRKDSSKYVLWSEIEQAWGTGASLLIYQHFAREARGTFLERLALELQRRLGCLEVFVLRTPRVAFFVVPQDDWMDTAKARAAELARKWEPHIRLEEPLKAWYGATGV